MPKSCDVHLDWVRYTVPYREHLSEETNLERAKPHGEPFNYTGEAFVAGQGYNRGRKLNEGAIFWNTEHFEEGIGVQITGANLDAIRLTDITEDDLLTFIGNAGGTMSTLHSCINVKNAGARPVDVLRAKKNGTLKTRARMIGHYSSETKVKKQWLPADTVYVGSPTSNVQIRIYNKAAERGIAGDWIRIEIVWHGRYAQAAFEAMQKHGITAVTRGAIRKQMDFYAAWWVFATTGDTALPEPTPRKETKRFVWLSTVVLAALESEIEEQRQGKYDTLFELYAAFIESKRPVK